MRSIIQDSLVLPYMGRMPTRFPPRQPWETYRLQAYLVLYLEEGSIAKTLVKTLLNGVNYKLRCAGILIFFPSYSGC